jgi:hypothetical protein
LGRAGWLPDAGCPVTGIYWHINEEKDHEILK